MTTVEIDIGKLGTAITATKDLANAIDLERNASISATPIALPTLEDGTLGQVSAWLNANVEELESRRDLARLLDEEGSGQASYEVTSDTLTNVQDLLGEQLSNRAEDLGYDPDSEDVELLSTLMTRWQNDPEVMSAMYEDLGPDGVVGVTANLEAALGFGSGEEGQLQELAEHLRSGLTTASNAPGFPAESFAEDMTRYAIAPMMSDDEREAFADRFPNGSGMAGASILTFLMQDSSYSDDFLLGAARTVDDFERFSQEADMPAEIWYGHNGHSALDTGKEDFGWYDDPMAAIMHNFGENPEAGLEFFTEDTADGWNRQTHYFNDRTWEADGYAGISHAVEGIGTSEANLTSDAQATTGLVSAFLDQVANSEGFNAEDAKPASPYVADLLKFYMPAVDDAVQFPNGDGDPGTRQLVVDHFGTLDPYPKIFTDDLNSLMQVSMSTSDGAQSVAEGIGGFQQAQLNNVAAAMAEQPNDVGLNNEMRDIVQRAAALQGLGEYNIGQVEIDGAVGRDEQRQAFIDLVGDAAGVIPMPGADAVGNVGSKVLDFAWSQSVDLGTGAAGEAFTNETEGAVDNSNSRAEAGLNRVKINTFLALVESGAIPQDAVPSSFIENGSVVTLSDISTDDMPYFASNASTAYNEYVTNFDIEGPYKNQFLEYYEDGEPG